MLVVVWAGCAESCSFWEIGCFCSGPMQHCGSSTTKAEYYWPIQHWAAGGTPRLIHVRGIGKWAVAGFTVGQDFPHRTHNDTGTVFTVPRSVTVIRGLLYENYRLFYILSLSTLFINLFIERQIRKKKGGGGSRWVGSVFMNAKWEGSFFG